MIDKFVDALESGAKELLAAGVTPPATAVVKLKRAIRNLQEYVDRVDRVQAARLVVQEDGTITAEYEPRSEPVIEVTADGIGLYAGERLSTALKRKRAEKGMTHGEVAKNLPISEETYRRIEDGTDYEIPDDLMEGLANHMGCTKEECTRMHEMDRSNPIRVAYPQPSRY